MKRWLTVFAVMVMSVSPATGQTKLSVYNHDLAVVKETKEMTFAEGTQVIPYTDVATGIDPTSVRFSVAGGGVTVIEQDYRYDLVNTQKMLRSYLDRRITVFMDEGEFAEGILRSHTGNIILENSDGGIDIIESGSIQRFMLPALPEGLISRPTLFWTVASEDDVTADAEITYLTSGLSWHAEYTAVITESEDELELSSWVSIENNSGATYADADLKLVAGDIHRAAPEGSTLPRERMMVMSMAEDAQKQFEERGFFEYHLYDLQRRTTLANAEIKQISLFEPVTVTAEKQYIYEPNSSPDQVSVVLDFVNSEQSGLGMPLPAGVMRVYKRDTDGELELAGEDRIDHTPKNEDIRVTLGYAFDIAAERQVVDTRQIGRTVRELDVEMSLRNRKDEAVTITAIDHFRGDWDIRDASHNYEKTDATTAEFTVSVPADSEVTISYTVRQF